MSFERDAEGPTSNREGREGGRAGGREGEREGGKEKQRERKKEGPRVELLELVTVFA